VVLRFTPEAADDAEGWLFHPTQTMERDVDGSLIVHFQSGGANEICWHLFTWGKNVQILKPQILRDLMSEMLNIYEMGKK
jgi:predicted DNA-binding transcriptional regulator YafY